MRAKRVAWIIIVALVAYVAVGSLLNYVVFPEPGPLPSDTPRAGVRIHNEAIQSTFVYRRTASETNGQIFEWDNYIKKGGGPIDHPHVHELAEERFRVINGALRIVVDGKESIVETGQEVVVPPGSLHGFQAIADGTTYVVSSLSPPFQVDEVYVQMARAGGLWRVSPIQLLVFATRYDTKTGVPGLPPFKLARALGYLVAPTARLFGIKSYYPPPSLPTRDLSN